MTAEELIGREISLPFKVTRVETGKDGEELYTVVALSGADPLVEKFEISISKQQFLQLFEAQLS